MWRQRGKRESKKRMIEGRERKKEKGRKNGSKVGTKQERRTDERKERRKGRKEGMVKVKVREGLTGQRLNSEILPQKYCHGGELQRGKEKEGRTDIEA